MALPIVGSAGFVVGVDISLEMLTSARMRLDEPSYSAVNADGQALTFKDGAFDAVVCQLGLQFFPNPAAGLAEFRRVVRANGGGLRQRLPFTCGKTSRSISVAGTDSCRRAGPSHRRHSLTLGRQCTRLSCPSQKGCRSTAFRIFPAPERGRGSSRMSTVRGHL